MQKAVSNVMLETSVRIDRMELCILAFWLDMSTRSSELDRSMLSRSSLLERSSASNRAFTNSVVWKVTVAEGGSLFSASADVDSCWSILATVNTGIGGGVVLLQRPAARGKLPVPLADIFISREVARAHIVDGTRARAARRMRFDSMNGKRQTGLNKIEFSLLKRSDDRQAV